MNFDPFMDQNENDKIYNITNLWFYNEQKLFLNNEFKFLYDSDTFNWFVIYLYCFKCMVLSYSCISVKGNRSNLPIENIQHWEKIDFIILSPEIAKKLNVTDNTELNTNVLENSTSVEDMKQKVVDFFQGKTTLADKSAIEIFYRLCCNLCTIKVKGR